MFNNSNYIQVTGGFLALGFTLLQAIDWLFKKFEIDSLYFNIILIVLFISFLGTILYYFLKNRKKKKSNKLISKKSKIKMGINIGLTVLVLLLFLYFFRKINKNDQLINQELPKIVKLYDQGNTLQVFKITKQLYELNPNNELIKNYYNKSRKYAKLDLNKDGVEIRIKYRGDDMFQFVGYTPIDSFPVPNSWNSYQLKVIDGNFSYLFENIFNGVTVDDHVYTLPEINSEILENHIVMPGRSINNFRVYGRNTGKTNIPTFSISKNEVSNIEYQEFVNDGGYQNPTFWDFPFKIDDKLYEFKKTVSTFKGKFGKNGPANWSYGKFPNGLGDHPVSGISWFEARAYAKYKNQELPNMHQWTYAAKAFTNTLDQDVMENGNFNSDFTKPVNSDAGSLSGINNIGGNVKEWLINRSGNNKDKFSAAGGSYLEPSYQFIGQNFQNPNDRSIGNGIRLVKNLSSDNNTNLDNYSITQRVYRELDDEPSVSDEMFDYYKSQFDYPKNDINVQTNFINDPNDIYTIESFSMEPAYRSQEKLTGFIIYSSKNLKKPNPVIVFPHAGSLRQNNIETIPPRLIRTFSYLLDEGYAIIYPIYSGLYNRSRNNECDDDIEYCRKNNVFRKGKDYKKVIDYLETRSDFNFNNLSYYGSSMGANYSNWMLAIDDRVKSAFLLVGGVNTSPQAKEIDQHNYTRRIKVPIFHIVGKLDPVVSYEKAFLPWKKIIGTPKKDLRIIEMDNVGHYVPRDTIYAYHKNWIEKYSSE